MLALGFGFFDLWELYQKVSFDPVQRLIFVNEGVTELDIRTDVYSDWKEWFQLSDYTGQAPPAIRTIGGDPTGDGVRAGDIYFLINGWKLVFDPSVVAVTGVLLSDDFDTAYWRDPVGNTIRDDLIPVFPAVVSNLVTTVEVRPELSRSLDYDGTVTIDPAGELAGTEYPTGTRARPVNNVADALVIAEAYSINNIEILNGDLTIAENISGYTIYAENKFQRVILDPAGAFADTEFESLTVEGDAGCNRVYLKECSINDLSNVEGTFRYCGFNGNITVCANGEIVASQCYSEIPGIASPRIIFGSNSQVSLRSYSGGMLYQNMSAGDVSTVEYVAGKLKLDNTNTGGFVSVRGVVQLLDTSAGTTVDTAPTVTDLVVVDASSIDFSNANIIVDTATPAEIVAEMDANSTQLAAILANTTVIDDRIANMSVTLGGIDSDMTAVLSSLSSIESTTSTTNNQIANVNISNESLVNSVANLDANVVAISTDVTEIRGDVTSIDSTVVAIGDTVDQVNNTVLAINSDLSNVAVDVTQIKNDVANLSLSGGLTPAQAIMLLEMYELLGLDPTKPLVVTENARTAGNISQTIDTNNTRTIVTRD